MKFTLTFLGFITSLTVTENLHGKDFVLLDQQMDFQIQPSISHTYQTHKHKTSMFRPQKHYINKYLLL